jgi:hypothetical protein
MAKIKRQVIETTNKEPVVFHINLLLISNQIDIKATKAQLIALIIEIM